MLENDAHSWITAGLLNGVIRVIHQNKAKSIISFQHTHANNALVVACHQKKSGVLPLNPNIRLLGFSFNFSNELLLDVFSNVGKK